MTQAPEGATSLCVQCKELPRLGVLTRCVSCIKIGTDTDGQSRAAAEAHVETPVRQTASRAVRFTQADIARALKAAQKAKLPIGGVRIEPDGSILIVTAQPEAVAPSDAENEWEGATP